MINCKINGKQYRLRLLISEADKASGLMKYLINSKEGLLFVYDTDVQRGFTFRNIHYPCIIYFLSEDFKILHKEKTKPMQRRIVHCPEKFRYAIEILA